MVIWEGKFKTDLPFCFAGLVSCDLICASNSPNDSLWLHRTFSRTTPQLQRKDAELGVKVILDALKLGPQMPDAVAIASVAVNHDLTCKEQFVIAYELLLSGRSLLDS